MSGPRIGSLFSGYGGLEQGVQAVLGGRAVWHSDIDPGACKILAHRYPDVPNLGDITAVDWSAVEPVDVLTGGFPCQDVSAAGLRKGLRPDTRSGLWTQMAYAVDQLRPSLVVIENVRGLLSAEAHSDLEPCPWCVGDGGGVPLRALGAVLGDLADIGYDASWHGLRAADVGAPHGRFRVFVTAWPAADAGGARRGRRGGLDDHAGEWREGHDQLGRRSIADAEGNGREEERLAVRAGTQRPSAWGDRGAAANAARYGRHQGWPESAWVIGGPDAAFGGAPAAAHPDRHGLIGQSGSPAGRNAVRLNERNDADRRGPHTHPDASGLGRRPSGRDDGIRSAGLVQVDWGQYEPAVRRWEQLTRPAPSPTELSAKGSPRLSPAFVEWMQGLPAGWVTDVPGLTRNEQLKALGNGVVPQQAAQALRLLLSDVGEVAA